MTARERVEMTARETVEVMVRTSRGSMTVWSASEVRDALDALESAVAARTREQVAQEIEANGYSTGDLPAGQLGAWIDSRSRAARIARNGPEETPRG